MKKFPAAAATAGKRVMTVQRGSTELALMASVFKTVGVIE